MTTILLILVLIALVALVVGGWWAYRSIQLQLLQAAAPEKMTELVNTVFGKSANQIAAQSKAILAGEKETIQVDLNNKQVVMEKLVNQLREEMKTKQDELRGLEKDRLKQFAELTTALTDHRKMTDELKTSTEQLASVLSNNQMRGEWGEKIIEELLRSNGLMEGRQYVRQQFLAGSTTLKPDISLILPDGKVVPVDAKFPYQEIQKMAVAETKAAKAGHSKQFETDLKVKITKVAAYINPEFNTLDYAIMFVPNEMVFSFINQKFPHLVDEALNKRVMIVSPFTFLIVARTVLESYRNFMIGDKLKAVVKYIDEFAKEWGLFKEEFGKFGRSIDTLKTGFEKLSTTRTKQMDKRIDRIDTYRTGSMLPGIAKKTAEPAVLSGEVVESEETD
jgi:DNA recombination protein RmuC